MSRIKACFEALRAQNKKALIPYIVAGDPTLELTLPLMQALVEAGANIIELGVPFSDPMAEGPTIALGHERALAQGSGLSVVINMVARFRESDNSTPVILMGYCNPIERMGHEEFVMAASSAGLDAVIIVDMPPEEVAPLNARLGPADIDNIFLVAPTTPENRIRKISEAASGFIYYVSLKGVTGAGHLDAEDVARRLGDIRRHSALPVAVGFGIKDAASARSVAAVADGVVVGSALVQVVAEAAAQGQSAAEIITAAKNLLADIRAGIDSLNMGQ